VTKEHVVAVPLDEDGPDGIELGFARLRRVRLEDLTNGAKGRSVCVLPEARLQEQKTSRELKAEQECWHNVYSELALFVVVPAPLCDRNDDCEKKIWNSIRKADNTKG
jgi:hypothetical protein